MAYIDYDFYTTNFHGVAISEEDFPRLAEIASDVIDGIVQCPVPDDIPTEVKKATAYQVECLYMQGGIDAVTGFADGLTAQSVRVGNYSASGVSSGNAADGAISVISWNGIPVSKLAVSQLRKAGLMSRWAYGRCRHD